MIRRAISWVLISAGLLVLGVVGLPIALAQLSFVSQAKLIDPTAVSYRLLAGSPILGKATADYTDSSTWFDQTQPLPPVSSRVNYYTLSIPRLKMFDVSVEINGTNLKKNAIHFKGSALPGTYGNAVVFGHSTLPQLYRPGDPLSIFNPLPKIEKGDMVIVRYDGVVYQYVVRDTAVVLPDQVEVLAQRYDKHELTLITCVPLGTYLRRFVARAELVN